MNYKVTLTAKRRIFRRSAICYTLCFSSWNQTKSRQLTKQGGSLNTDTETMDRLTVTTLAETVAVALLFDPCKKIRQISTEMINRSTNDWLRKKLLNKKGCPCRPSWKNSNRLPSEKISFEHRLQNIFHWTFPFFGPIKSKDQNHRWKKQTRSQRVLAWI